MKPDELENNKIEYNNQSNRTERDTNRIMGMAAIFISVLSMVAVIYQSYLAREDNELTRIQQSASVLPYLDYYYSDLGAEYKFVIENKGVGPAFIKDLKLKGFDLEKEDTVFFSSSNRFLDFLGEKSSFLDSIPTVNNSFYSNLLLSPGEKRAFFVFSFENKNQKNKFRKEYYKYYAGYEIIYEDVYANKWILDSKRVYPVKLKKN